MCVREHGNYYNDGNPDMDVNCCVVTIDNLSLVHAHVIPPPAGEWRLAAVAAAAAAGHRLGPVSFHLVVLSLP